MVFIEFLFVLCFVFVVDCVEMYGEFIGNEYLVVV